MSLFFRYAVSFALLLGANIALADSYADPPGRVARLSYTRGDVSFSPAGESDWVVATLNRPLIRGDRLWTDRDARAELQLGSAAVRLDEGTSLQLLNLDDRAAQVEVTQGTLNLRVRRLYQGQSFEVDTPTLAFEITRPGQYRIDVDAQGKYTTVAVWDGGGTAYGERANFPVREGEAIRFYDSDLRDYQVYDIPRPDDFDRFCQSRDDRYERSVSRRYVSEDMVGYSDLDEYGSWSEVREYGSVWYPTRVSAGWAPYRDGRWIWQEPWGWTWVDASPWGFAPFHYGRWAQINSRWGWIPGPVSVRPVYAPALVAFVGGRNWSLGVNLGGGSPIGWFPLGPREVYVPSYRVSRNYFTSINVSNTTINNTYITNVYNDYSAGRTLANVNYAYRSDPGALTAVSSNTFVNAQPVSQGMIRMNRDVAARGEVMRVAALTPVQRSVVGGAAVANNVPQRAVVERNVVARNAPPPAIAPFAQREQALRRDPGRPLETGVAESMTQPRAMRGGANERPQAPDRIRVVGNGEGAVNTRALAPNAERGGPRDMGERAGADRAVSERGGPNRDAGERGGRETLERGRGSEPVLRSGGDEGRAARGPRADAERAPAENREVGRPPARNEGLPSRGFRSGESVQRDNSAERATRERGPQSEQRGDVPTRRLSPETQQSEDRPQREERSMRSNQDEQRPQRIERREEPVRRVEPQVQRQEREMQPPQREERVQRIERREEQPVRRVEPQQQREESQAPRVEQPQRVERQQPRFEPPQRREEPPQQQREQAPARAIYAPRQDQPPPQQEPQQQAQPQRQAPPQRERKEHKKRGEKDDDDGN